MNIALPSTDRLEIPNARAGHTPPATMASILRSLSILSTVLLAGMLVALSSDAEAQLDLLPSIPKGTISISLSPIVTGLGAPDYAISAPGDTSRLFVLEQKGAIVIILNGALLPTPALDIQSLISTTINLNNENDERALLARRFHVKLRVLADQGGEQSARQQSRVEHGEVG